MKELPKGLKVTITVGSLIALGSVMLAFNPFACLVLSFAGITDACSMGAMPAKMPWNR